MCLISWQKCALLPSISSGKVSQLNCRRQSLLFSCCWARNQPDVCGRAALETPRKIRQSMLHAAATCVHGRPAAANSWRQIASCVNGRENVREPAMGNWGGIRCKWVSQKAQARRGRLLQFAIFMPPSSLSGNHQGTLLTLCEFYSLILQLLTVIILIYLR